MSRTLELIQKPVEADIQEFEKKFSSYTRTKILLLDKIMDYIVKRKGKQIRPVLVFLVSGACGGVNDRTHRGAALIELLHTATLVHDDVVDDSAYRRGFFSINALWKNKIAVLVGDYLLSRGLLLSVDNGDFDLLKIVSQAVREMSEGELLQMEKARLLNITEEVYFEIIRQKTATLIASCCAVGAAAAGAQPETIAQMLTFGEKIGMAFQIKDDLFDYGTAEIGKPVGIDIKEKKLTLPLIYALRKASWTKRQQVILSIRTDSQNPKTVKKVIEFVKESGGIAYTEQAMQSYYNQALELLNLLPKTDYRDSLESLMAFVIEREK
jgi:octaprenyl-diphosphate synthase